MQHLLPDGFRKLRRTVYYSNAQMRVEMHDGDLVPISDVKELEALADQSELAYYTTLKQLSESVKQVEEALVGKISVAVSMSLPNLSFQRMEHALFAKQMFVVGEFSFRDYITKMQNLFPDRMAALSASLQQQISDRLGS